MWFISNWNCNFVIKGKIRLTKWNVVHLIWQTVQKKHRSQSSTIKDSVQESKPFARVLRTFDSSLVILLKGTDPTILAEVKPVASSTGRLSRDDLKSRPALFASLRAVEVPYGPPRSGSGEGGPWVVNNAFPLPHTK